MLRVYWNVPLEHLPLLVEAVTRVLPDAGIRFCLKVFYRQTRCDAGVIYLNREDWSRAADPIASVYKILQPFMPPATPYLTLRLADGLGLAEDPGEGESFGWTRMEIDRAQHRRGVPSRCL